MFGIQIGTPEDRFNVTRHLKEELPVVALISKVLKIDEWNDHLKTATALLDTGRICAK